MNDNEIKIAGKINEYLHRHGDRTTEFVKKASSLLVDLPHENYCSRFLYEGDRAVIAIVRDELIDIVYKPGIRHEDDTTMSVFAAGEHQHIHAYSETSVTNAEAWWIDKNRLVDGDVVNELAEKVEEDVRLMNDVMREVDFIVDREAKAKIYSDKAKEMFGI